ncbi:MAG TPA: protein kinase [Pyrinomonadaceae bacterium]|jgi:serine/threonine protein kinase/WD40 repeat protein|nr:protein kinase [Pyrinomonadaceae bacterium]
MGVVAGSRFGPYEIVSPLGAGGMGEVYRARDTRLGREVALKILPASFADDKTRLNRFRQEACAAGALNHPNILVIYDVGADDSAPYVVSELLEGETLRQRMAGAALPQRKAIDYSQQIAFGLAAAHDKGIVHRDLKPENLFITKDGRLKILDFGLAKLAQINDGEIKTDVPTRRVDTDPGIVLGTVGYMSPEQVRGQVVDHRSDIFAFGAILYEMLSGKRAFHAGSPAETMSAILKEDPPELSATNRTIPPALERLVHHCLEKSPEERFQSARDLAFDLQALSGTSSQTTSTSLLVTRFWKRGWERAAWLILTGFLLLAGLALAVPYFRSSSPPPDSHAKRFLISPPEQSNILGTASISPDGQRLLMRIADSTGKVGLWIRPLNGLAAQMLPGTEGAGSSFWSADSRSVAFFAAGKLKRIDIAGGYAQTICESPEGRGGTWNRDGTIIFSAIGSDGLLRVSASGGSPTLITKLDQSREESWHRLPYFLPDGKHFLFAANSARSEDSGVYVGALDSNETKRLIGASTNAIYAPPGYLLFVRETTLMVQRFDATTLQLAGDSQPLVEQINVSPLGSNSYSVSDDGVLVYLSGATKSELNWFDRNGKLLSSTGASNNNSNMSLSPDEKRVATAIWDAQTSTRDIWIIDPARATSTRFTFNGAEDFLPIWSPDGSKILFVSDRSGFGNLYEKPTSGAANEEEILKTDERKWPSDWSKDGQYVAYTSFGPKTKLDLWVLPMFGDRKPFPFLQTSFNEDGSRFSPDGHFIAYYSDDSGSYEVYVQPFPASGAKWQISSGGGMQPRWRRDGKELFFIDPKRNLIAVEVNLSQGSFEAGVPKTLFQTHTIGYSGPRNLYECSGDGQRFLINSLQSDAGSIPVTVVVNWMADLKR